MIARRRVVITIVALCSIVSATQFVHANGFTLEQVMSSPFPSDLIASKSGDKVAWVFDHLGRLPPPGLARKLIGEIGRTDHRAHVKLAKAGHVDLLACFHRVRGQ